MPPDSHMKLIFFTNKLTVYLEPCSPYRVTVLKCTDDTFLDRGVPIETILNLYKMKRIDVEPCKTAQP